jgi:pantoate--beta-alanine ligase
LRPGPDGTVGTLKPPGIRQELEPEMKVVATIEDVRALPRDGSVGLVPTMGALHEGHAALFRAARADCRLVVASLFVNAPQFSDVGDLAAYPSDRERDEAFAAANGVDVLFAPSVDEMYPPGFATWVEPAGVALGLEGEHRPGHFRAVATVCVKLFNQVQPDRAYFGRKDAQQVAVIKQVVRDLNLPLEIVVVPTVRDDDGLALSSRNARLSAADRARALAIPRALATRDAERARAVLAESGIEPDYVAHADLDGPTLAIAARVGAARLIDNVELDSEAD